jgi:DNA-binding NtrC family response regulator
MQHILVVDEQRVCARVAAALTPSYRVSPAKDGESAIKLLDHDRPDLVLLEAALPGMSGVELAAQVVGRGLPAIVTSRDSGICARLDRLGWPYLPKPFEIDALLYMVRETLVLAQQRRHAVYQSLEHFARVSGELQETIRQLRELRERVQQTLARSYLLSLHKRH